MSTRVLPFASYFNLQSTRMSDFRGRIPPAPITQPGPSQNQDQAAALLPGQVIHNPSPASTPRSARRNLFGPIDHEENMKLVQAELARIAQNDSRRWNFDFRNEVPLEGRYTWEATKGTVIPPAYEMPNLTARLTQLPTTTASTSMKKLSSTQSPPSTSTTEVCEPLVLTSLSNNPLRSTLSTVTTATTTVYTTSTMQKPQTTVTNSGKASEEASEKKTSSSPEQLGDQSTTTTRNKRQTRIPDFMKVKKRSWSDNKAEGVSSGSSSPEGGSSSSSTSPPLPKRAKTS